MEQSDYVSSTQGDVGNQIELTPLQRLQRFVALHGAPRQVHTISSSETEFRASLSVAEDRFVKEMDTIRFGLERGGIGKTTADALMRNISFDAMEAGVSLERRCVINTRAEFYNRETIKHRKLVARRKFAIKLSTLVKKFKGRKELGRNYPIGSAAGYIADFKFLCFLLYKTALYGFVKPLQARRITYSVARKFRTHSGKQLWRLVKADRTAMLYARAH